MSEPTLIVEVTNAEREAREEYVFARSPVRIGRSQRNELSLEHAFVSHCHGLLHFAEDIVEFVDVGSTNGTFVNGTRLATHHRVRLSERTTVCIGALRLQARLQHHDGVSPPRGTSERRDTQLCERFAVSFLELRRGQRQLMRALGLPPASADKLQTLDTPSALLAYLLDPAAPSGRLDELSRAHADLMRHELALVSAISAGSRELLEELSPQNLAPRGVGGFVTWLARLCGHDARWATLERKVDELHEDTALSSVVLGRGFARAYAAALDRSSEGPRASAADMAAEEGRP